MKPPYDPQFGDLRICKCGHHYYRHFDTYESMSPVGCKYCPCPEGFQDIEGLIPNPNISRDASNNPIQERRRDSPVAIRVEVFIQGEIPGEDDFWHEYDVFVLPRTVPQSIMNHPSFRCTSLYLRPRLPE